MPLNLPTLFRLKPRLRTATQEVPTSDGRKPKRELLLSGRLDLSSPTHSIVIHGLTG